jgi:peroxiredoxin
METKELPSVEVGSIVPDFHLPSGLGKDIGPGDYRGKANLVLFFVREFN